MTNDDDRFTNIEIKLARQEDLVDTLNQQIYRQQRKIDELETLCQALARRISEAAQSAGAQGPGNERPPHY